MKGLLYPPTDVTDLHGFSCYVATDLQVSFLARNEICGHLCNLWETYSDAKIQQS